MVQHRDRAHRPASQNTESKAWRKEQIYRATDRVVQRRQDLSVPVLSVAADKLAHTALRAVGLLTKLGQAGLDVDRSGMTGKVVEVYPAASLEYWGLQHRGYKSGEFTEKARTLSSTG